VLVPVVYRRIALVAGAVFVADQLSKLVVMRWLAYADQRVVFDGFFKIVHWGNTGAAWSILYGNNRMLALISGFAVLVLLLSVRNLEFRSPAGQVALGLIFGGILGNLTDRLRFGHVVDFLRFYLYQRGGDEIGFAAFNLADTGICLGVGLLFLVSWQKVPPAPGPISSGV
jgi:signal peptidase II